jgi:hypothetical protein
MILSNNIIKYFIIICILYYVIKLVPTQKLNDKDTLIIISILIMSFIFIENYYNKQNISELFSPIHTNNNLINTNQEVLKETKSEIKQYIPPITQQIEITPIPTESEIKITPIPTESEIKIDNTIKNTVNDEILLNYFTLLINDLSKNGFITNKEIDIMKLKLDSGLLTIKDLIKSLEYIKYNSTTVKIKDDNIYNEINKDFYKPIGDKIANEWDNDYNILNSDKWSVPMKQPPLCVNTTPCKVCDYDTNPNYTPLKHWDNSRYVSEYKINKKWIANQ